MDPQPSYVFDPGLHEPGTRAAAGRCSHHDEGDPACLGEAVVSFHDDDRRWQTGCSRALEDLVEQGAIEPLGQGA